MWGNCLVAFGFVISTFFRVVKNAVVFGYIYTIGSGLLTLLHQKCPPGSIWHSCRPPMKALQMA